MSSQPCQISGVSQGQLLTIVISGDWRLGVAKLPALTELLSQMRNDKQIRRVVFSSEGLQQWDSLLVTELIKLLDCASRQNLTVDKTTLPQAIQGLLTLVSAVPDRSDARRTARKLGGLAYIKLTITQAEQHLKQILIFMGTMAVSIASVVRGQTHFRTTDLWLYIQECGPAALPIISIISLLVGLILAFVGAHELSLFGAEIYVANLVSLGMTREMGGLMTAVIMSGRTGAAYAAQIGTMQVNEEIDALKTMNLEPMAFLVIPRMLALIFIMPLLCLYADLMGIIGGGLVTISLFDVSLLEYLDRSASAVRLSDFLIGFGKCAVFGVLIALSGCMRGMQCGRSASAVGDAATSAVVTCIVFIVIADSLITIICSRIGI
ncbi:ABC transporter permease [Methylomonas paludis]|uniref:ABC transporter permease n=1 Tax=Methylomonas paludis TaxID=1173101 RepID=A0A975MP73_9GAMM|nr:ABC transporter permease [Methylomonas paludis]QWF71488.1 ABC transporter permease [Methylomonas paludis]